jgi:hypothetical protein
VKIACVVRRGVAGKGSAPAETSPATYPARTGDVDAYDRKVCEMQTAETVLGVLSPESRMLGKRARPVRREAARKRTREPAGTSPCGLPNRPAESRHHATSLKVVVTAKAPRTPEDHRWSRFSRILVIRRWAKWCRSSRTSGAPSSRERSHPKRINAWCVAPPPQPATRVDEAHFISRVVHARAVRACLRS